MKDKRLLIFILVLFNAVYAFGQLTAEALQSAVAQQQCAEIADELDRTPLRSEDMKFNGAVCLFRNGAVEWALTLFQEITQLEGQKQHLATFWVAKCYATLGHDSLVLANLLAIPPGQLSYPMLSQPMFDRMAKNNTAFVQLKASVKPRFNIRTGGLAVIAVIGLLIGFVLLLGRSRFSAGEKRLAVVMFSFALILTSYVFIWTNYVIFFPYLQNVWPFLTFLVGPSLFLYLKDPFKEDYTAKEAALHYVIPAISGLLTIPVFLSSFRINTGISPDFALMGSAPTLLTRHLLYYSERMLGAKAGVSQRTNWQFSSGRHRLIG